MERRKRIFFVKIRTVIYSAVFLTVYLLKTSYEIDFTCSGLHKV